MGVTIVVSMLAKADTADKVKAKLAEAASVYVNDKGTLDWIVCQNPKDKTQFTIVERYQDKAAIGVHAKNPYFKEFGAYMQPLLAKPSQLSFLDEFASGNPPRAKL